MSDARPAHEDCAQITYRKCGQYHTVHAFFTIVAYIDYCNSVFHCVSAVHVLQLLQNTHVLLNAAAPTIMR